MLVLILEIIVALLNGIGGNISVEMMDVMVFDSVGKGLEDVGNLQKGTSFKGSLSGVPFVFALSVREVDWVLKMEETCSYDGADSHREPHVEGRNPKQREDPSIEDHWENLLKIGHAEYSVSLGNGWKDQHKPDEGDSNQEEHRWWSQYPCQDLLYSFHLLVLLQGKEDGLGDIQPVNVTEMFVVVVVAVPPCIEGEVLVDSDYFADDGVGLHRAEEGEMSHVMKLDKDPYGVECV